MIPCIKNKCLLFAVCKNKTIIYCEELMAYFESEYRKIDDDLNNANRNNFWIDLNKDLPTLTRIFTDYSEAIDLHTISYTSSYTAKFLRSMNKAGQRFQSNQLALRRKGKCAK